MSADRALGEAIRAAAMGDAGVKATLGDPVRFFDERPLNAALPCVTFARFESRAADAAEAQALEQIVTLNVWSRQGGRAETLDALAALRAALHDATLTIEGRTLVLIHAVFSDAFRVGDGQTTQGVLRLRAITEEA
ncbi:MAG: DUF3168 domain-containing protein [Alphaproteobacteria bacterium]|nr:DUF3168 domain-containing protein [Alphaproteobacteria bacterium]